MPLTGASGNSNMKTVVPAYKGFCLLCAACLVNEITEINALVLLAYLFVCARYDNILVFFILVVYRCVVATTSVRALAATVFFVLGAYT
jgi:hypothetical protein